MKLLSPLLLASLLFSLPMAHAAMEPEDLNQNLANVSFKQAIKEAPLDSQISLIARLIAELQLPDNTNPATDLEIAAQLIEATMARNPRALTEAERAQLSSIAQSVDAYLEQHAAIAQSPNGGYLAAVNAQLASFVAPQPEAQEQDEKAQAEEEFNHAAFAAQMEAGQQYFEAGVKNMANNLAGFIANNPELTELPGRFAAAQAKLVKREFAGTSFSLDAAKRQSLLATAQVYQKHAEQEEEVNQFALGLDLFRIQMDLGFQQINKFAPPVKASAKTTAKIWANADWASVLPGLQQVSHSLMTCLSTVLANYEAQASRVDGAQSGEEEEEEDGVVEGAQAAQEAAEAELQAMIAALGTTSSSSANLDLP
jgi:hypothetical protein